MKRIRARKRIWLTAVSVAAFATCVVGSTSPAWADGGWSKYDVDVAMNGLRFFDFEENPDPARAGIPPDGSPFIIQGYIYPAGTFARYGNLSGVLADGSPEFPELVIGLWTCRGWHLQDGDAVTGPVVVTTQIFDFKLDEPGRHTIVTDGFELADFDLPFQRAVTGGTGAFNGVEGEMTQVYVWDEPSQQFLNASGGFQTSFAFKLKRARHHPMRYFPRRHH